MFLLTLQSLHFSDMIATASLHILQRVFALSAPGFYYNHDSNTSSPKRWIISDLIWDRMLLHPPKAPLSIVVTLLGIMMLTSDPHPPKAPFIIRKTKRFAIPERAVYFLKTKRTAGGTPPPQNIFDRLTPVFT